jgi:hypothetical protein
MELVSPLSCAQYLATYSCPKTVESSLCLPNLYCLKICCNAFLSFMTNLQSSFLTSDVCMHFTSVHASFIPFPSHPILFLICDYSCVTVTDMCFYCQICQDVLAFNLRYWHICSGICVLKLQILLNWYRGNILGSYKGKKYSLLQNGYGQYNNYSQQSGYGQQNCYSNNNTVNTVGTTSRMDVVNEMEVQFCAHREARIREVDIKAKGSTSNCSQNYNGAQASTSSTHRGMYSVHFMLPNITDNNMHCILSNRFFQATCPPPQAKPSACQSMAANAHGYRQPAAVQQ